MNTLEISDFSEYGLPIRLPRPFRVNSARTVAEGVVSPAIISKELNEELAEITGVASEEFPLSTLVFEFVLQENDFVIYINFLIIFFVPSIQYLDNLGFFSYSLSRERNQKYFLSIGYSSTNWEDKLYVIRAQCKKSSRYSERYVLTKRKNIPLQQLTARVLPID